MRRQPQGDQEPPVLGDTAGPTRPAVATGSRPPPSPPSSPSLKAPPAARPEHAAPRAPGAASVSRGDATREVRRGRPPVPSDTSHLESMGTLLGDLDAAFGAIVDPTLQKPSSHPPEWAASSSIAEIRELFSALAANHMRQVRDFMIAVRWGEAHREWAAICQPAVLSMVRAAGEMEMEPLRLALSNYAAVLRVAADSTAAMLVGAIRDDLVRAYEELAAHMPEVFALEGERDRREAIIVHALLQQVPEVRKLTIDRMYAAGLTSLDTLFLAKADDIAATTGIGEALASLIVAKFQEYRREAALLVDPSRAAECRRLRELIAEMRHTQEQFDAAANAWGDDAHAAKKGLRRARADLLLRIKVLLARLGEIDRIAALERLAFAHKIEHLDAFLHEVQLQHQQPQETSSSKLVV